MILIQLAHCVDKSDSRTENPISSDKSRFCTRSSVYCAKRLFPPPVASDRTVRLLFVRKVITFWAREMSVPDGHTSPVKIKVRISVFEKSNQKLGLAFCRSLLRDPVLELQNDLFRNTEIIVLT